MGVRGMKKLFFYLVFAICAVTAFGQNILVLAPLLNEGGIEEVQIRTLSRLLENAIQRTRRFDIIDRGAAEDILKEHGFQLSDLSDTRKTAELGRVLNANFLVRPSVMPLAGDLFLESRIVEMNTARMLNSAEVRIRADLSDAYDKLGGLAQALTGTVPAANIPARNVPVNNIPANMVLVEGGTFQMGSTGGDSDERPVHTVTVGSFYRGRTEVTQKEWMEVMGNNPSNFRGDNLPVEMVSWNDAIEYCNRLSLKEGLTPAYRGSGNNITCDFNASGYRLPTEAEWEYAAKGGNKDYISYEYSGSNSVDVVAWYNGNSGNTTHPVGTKRPNSLGLYDMNGNVWEWCWDWYGGYSGGSQTDPAGPSGPTSSGTYRVLRGGSWGSAAAYVRSAFRNYDTPSSRSNYIGFRLVRPQF
jgi:formylglycine-generating enzyme required for sulfatase activity